MNYVALATMSILVLVFAVTVTLKETNTAPWALWQGQPVVETMTSLPACVALLCFSVLSIMSVCKMMHAHDKAMRSGSCHKMNEDSLQKARRIKADLGRNELEVSCGGEADLHRSLILCEKNPQHRGFIPVKDFNKTYLPAHFQDDNLVDLIKAEANLTVRVSVEVISVNRPEYFPDSDKPFPLYNHRGSSNSMTTGTGRVAKVFIFTEKDNKICECKECWGPVFRKLARIPIVCHLLFFVLRILGQTVTTPKKEWGEAIIETAAHVVYDQTEAQHTSCCFFYDDSNSDFDTLLTLRGLDVVKSDARRDWCRMRYISHDIQLLNKLSEMCNCCVNLGKKVTHKYRVKEKNSHSSANSVSVNDPEHRLSICVSHPHGCPKQISLGEWTDRQTVQRGKYRWYRGQGTGYDGEWTRYTYNTPTCPGSSGSLIFSPVREWVTGGGWWAGLGHVHCEGYIDENKENINCSTVDWELVQPPA